MHRNTMPRATTFPARGILVALVALAMPALASAQHDHPASARDTSRAKARAVAKPAARSGGTHGAHGANSGAAKPPLSADVHAAHGATDGTSLHPLGLPHSRHGSGTSWLPDDAPLHHLMGRGGDWTLMGHGAAFAGWIEMNGPRGDERFAAPNMVMVMGERSVTPRTLWRLSGMFSTDIATVGGGGYPILLQTGETWKGEPLRDHQHPHNILSELSVSLVHALAPGIALQLYAAPVGEPALGPPAFPHRPVGLRAPLAPIGHHWQDATHIAYGVLTAGLQTARVQIEGSTFNGREPGEDRLAIDRPKFDSASGRVSVNPFPSLALQISHGYLHEPETTHPGIDAWRTTASAIHARELGARSADLTLVWGRNHADGLDLDSWLIEGEWVSEPGLTPFARVEWIEKSAEELVLPEDDFDHDEVFALRQATLGAALALPGTGDWVWSVGAQGTLSFVPRELEGVYGENPGGWAAFVSVHPRASRH